MIDKNSPKPPEKPELKKELERILKQKHIAITMQIRQIQALIPDRAEVYLEGYNDGAKDADTDNKETAEVIRKQIEEEMLQILEREYPLRVIWQRYQALKEGK